MEVFGATHSSRRLAGVLWKDRGDAQWLVRRRAEVAYLGWVRRGNVGDEAMYMVHQALMGGRLPVAPLHSVGRNMARWAGVGTLIVGGGTIIGRQEWLGRLSGVLTALAPRRLIIFGPGVEDIDFALKRGLVTTAGLRSWSELLGKADYVGVRGPQSQDSLQRLGIAATVIGDPGLLVDRVVPRSKGNRRILAGGRIAINLAAVADGYLDESQGPKRRIVQAAELLSKRGHSIVFFSMEADDFALMDQLAPKGSRVIPWTGRASQVIEEIQKSDLVISERLHGGILAASYGLPFLQVGYKPKVHDFAASVGAQELIVEADVPSPLELADRAERLLAAGTPRHVQKSVQRVQRDFLTGHNSILRA